MNKTAYFCGMMKLLLLVGLLLLGSTFVVAPLYAQGPVDALQRLNSAAGGTAEVSINKATGFAAFVRLGPGTLPFKSTGLTNQATANQAMAFLETHGAVFGIQNAGQSLRQTAVQANHFGGFSVSYQQIYRGIPVFAGTMRVHFDANGDLFAVNGTFIPHIKLTTHQTITAETAAELALKAVSVQLGDSDKSALTNIKAEPGELLVFRANLAQGIPGPNHLVYEVVVSNAGNIREFLYIDAQTGQLVDQISGIHSIDREVSENSLASIVWDESAGDPDPIPGGWNGGSAGQVSAWQDEIDGAAETYYLFSSMTGGTYLSYDGADATLRTVNNDPSIACPNANWNGTSTNYCNGVTGDDTVAHEWGHAYTEYTNGLIYRWQSGALNESYSDIWGEVVDFLNGRGTDSPNTMRSTGACSIYGQGTPSSDNSYRWLSGEDDPAFGGAIRDMWRPQCYGDPGHTLDAANYHCTPGDNGGVHINSGVPNHAFALMVDGGSYTNSSSTVLVAGIGITKAAHIHWAAQNMLTPASDFSNHADALEAACSALTGQPIFELSTAVTTTQVSGAVISAGDCTQVANAIAAVELRADVSNQCGFTPILDPNAPPVCPHWCHPSTPPLYRLGDGPERLDRWYT